MIFRHHLKIYYVVYSSTLCSRSRSYISIIRTLYLSSVFRFLQHFSFKLNPLFPEPSGIGNTMRKLQHEVILCKLQYTSFFLSVLLPQDQNSRTLLLPSLAGLKTSVSVFWKCWKKVPIQDMTSLHPFQLQRELSINSGTKIPYSANLKTFSGCR